MTGSTFCESCGEQLSQTARFCRHCGAPRTPDTAAQPTGPASSAPTASWQAPSADAPPAQTAAPWPGAAQGQRQPPGYVSTQPGYVPEAAAAPPVANDRRPWPIIVGAITALLLVVGATAAAIVLSSGGASLHSATILTVTAPGAAGAGAPGSTESTGGGNLHTTSVGVSTSNAGASVAGAMSFVAYHGSRFTARVPSGWTLIEAEMHKEGYVESKWRNPANPSDTVLIDAGPAPHLSLQQDAAPVHEALLKEQDYQELYYGSGDLTGLASWMWIFRASGNQRVDYFFEDCTNGFGVLGSTLPGRFNQLRGSFRAIAQSVQSTCH